MAWYRTRARGLAALLLVAWVSLGAATAAPHHDDCHEAVCRTTPAGPHDHSSHRIGSPPTPDEHPLHCVVCHWIRAFKPLGQSASASAAAIPAAIAVYVVFVASPSAFPAAQPPLRAPPIDPHA